MTDAGAGKHIEIGDVVGLQEGIIAADRADIHARLGPGDVAGHDACVLEGLPTYLQQQPLLRVDANGLAGRNAEELGVELVHAFEKRRPNAYSSCRARRDRRS